MIAQPTKPVLTYEQFVESYFIFRMVGKLPYNKNARRKFFNFLGFKEETWKDLLAQDQIHVDDDVMRKLEMLHGPHAYAIYRAWLANQ